MHKAVAAAGPFLWARGTGRSLTILGVGIALLCALGIGLYYFGDIISSLDTAAVEGFLEKTRNSPWAIFVVWLTYLLAGITFFPVTIISLAVAAVFGFTGGIILGMSGAMLSATLLFWIGQTLGQEKIRKVIPRSVEKFDRKLKRSGLMGVTMLRLVLYIPFSAFNLIMGMASVRYRDFIIGSVLGLFPGFIVRGLIGDSLVKILLNPTPQPIAYLVGGAILWIGFVLLIQKLIKRSQDKAEHTRV